MLLNQICKFTNHFWKKNRNSSFAVKRRDWDAPSPLARNTPIGSGFHSTFNSVFAPVWNPFDFIDFSQNNFSKRRRVNRTFAVWFDHLVNFDEPLIHRAEDNGRFAAPAMRITMMVILLMQQRVAQTQFMQNNFVRVTLAMLFQNGFADKFSGHLLFNWQIVCVGKFSIIINRRINRQASKPAKIVVVQTMTGRDVNETRSCRAFDKSVACKKFSGAIAKWVLIFQPREFTT